MGKQTSKNIKVGIILLTGTIFLFLALYLIGSNQNLFGSNITITAIFREVNGLTTGNNVRFAGIDIGTVKEVAIINDTTVEVTMLIRNESTEYIRKDAIASIGTDGLMGNKLVNIANGSSSSALIADGDVIASAKSSEIESLISSLGGTSEDIGEVVRHIKQIVSDSAFQNLPQAVSDITAAAGNIKSITQKADQSSALWSLLNDKKLAEDLKISVDNVRKTSEQAALLSADLRLIIQDIEAGKGTAGMLMKDSLMAQQLKVSAGNIRVLSDSLVVLSAQLNGITRQINSGKGAAGTIVSDTVFAQQMKQTMTHVQNSARSLEENMEALKSNFLFRKYFKKKEKNGVLD